METRSTTFGILREQRPGERRVAMMPADVKRLARSTTLYVERGAGALASVKDELFFDPKTSMLFGDARQSLLGLALEVKNA